LKSVGVLAGFMGLTAVSKTMIAAGKKMRSAADEIAESFSIVEDRTDALEKKSASFVNTINEIFTIDKITNFFDVLREGFAGDEDDGGILDGLFTISEDTLENLRKVINEITDFIIQKKTDETAAFAALRQMDADNAFDHAMLMIDLDQQRKMSMLDTIESAAEMFAFMINKRGFDLANFAVWAARTIAQHFTLNAGQLAAKAAFETAKGNAYFAAAVASAPSAVSVEYARMAAGAYTAAAGLGAQAAGSAAIGTALTAAATIGGAFANRGEGDRGSRPQTFSQGGPLIDIAGTVGEEERRQRNITIVVENFIGTEDWVRTTLAPLIKDFVGDGGDVGLEIRTA
ncbi:hypothetical protein LCGC14_2874900, partial [marine sediment metagenome]